MSFTTITLTGHYEDASGVAASGAVTFQLTQQMQQPGQPSVDTNPVTATLSGSGTFSIALTATDDAATVPQGVAYQVTEQLHGVPEKVYGISLPSAAPGGTIDIASCPTVDLPSP